MKLNIRGEKKEITSSMKDYAIGKTEKLSKYIDDSNETEVYVLFKLNGIKHRIEVTIPLKNFTLRVEEEAEDFYAAIDKSIDKLERQIRKNKTRLQSQRFKKYKDLVLSSLIEEEEQNTSIIKRKKVELKPMSEEEAILQMELLDHDFYIFKDIETNDVTVIYKRKDGNYGIIEAE